MRSAKPSATSCDESWKRPYEGTNDGRAAMKTNREPPSVRFHAEDFTSQQRVMGGSLGQVGLCFDEAYDRARYCGQDENVVRALLAGLEAVSYALLAAAEYQSVM